MGDRADHVGTIENTRKLLDFLEGLSDPSEIAKEITIRLRAEVDEYDRGMESERVRQERISGN
jgi:hypothetical protein